MVLLKFEKVKHNAEVKLYYDSETWFCLIEYVVDGKIKGVHQKTSISKEDGIKYYEKVKEDLCIEK